MEKERICLSNELKGIKIRDFEELRSRILSIYKSKIALPKSVKKKGLVKYLTKVRQIHDFLMNEFYRHIQMLPKFNELHPFYQELIRMSCADERYDDILGKVLGFRKVLLKLTREYSERIRLSFDVPEARKLTREYIGRVLSIFRRLRKDLRCLSSIVVELRKLPCISVIEPIIVVAGMPQVGKSTFVSRVSTAKPEISPFPFTTKEIIVGHFEVNFKRIQIIDTPGILDRPLHELNQIEKRALAAIKCLTNCLIFLIDPYEGSYYSLESQLNLLKNIMVSFKDLRNKIIVAINKIDLVNEERLNYVKAKVKELFNGDIYLMSALKGIGVKEVINAALKLLGYS